MAENENELYLPIYVRAYARVVEEKPRFGSGKREPEPPRWARTALVIDFETTTNLEQQLNFGWYRWCELQPDGNYVCVEEGICYANDLDRKSVRLLHEFCHKKKADAAPGEARQIKLFTRDEFVDGPLWDIIRAGGVIVGHNLAFDISRLAFKYGIAKGRDAGWSLSIFGEKVGTRIEDRPFRPRVVVTPKDSHAAFFRLAGGYKRGQRPEWPVKKGRFIDTATLVFALRNAHMSLKAACKEFKTLHQKIEDHKPEGKVTPDEIRYARQDVACTVDLLNAVKREYDSFKLTEPPEKIVSTASITKALLKDMGLVPPKDKFPLSDKVLGRATQAYFGGRTESRIRLTDVPCVYYDATSEYPTSAALLGIWNLLRARTIQVQDCTQEVQQLLDSLTLDQLLDKKTWSKLGFFAKIKPAGDIVPVRAPYDEESRTIGINHLYSDELWFAGPDLAASKVLNDNKAPEILEAFRLVPHGTQRGFKQVKLGKRDFNPSREDFFVRIIEERQALKHTDKHHPHVLMLKIVANALYGSFAELNSQSFSRNLIKHVEVFSGDCESFITKSEKLEVPGFYHFMPAAGLITSGGRLLLVIFETLVKQAGGHHAMMDTDSVIVVSGEAGGLIPCKNGTEQMSDGRQAVRALTWKQADEIAQRFDRLNPYNPKIIPHLFKKEDCNFDANGRQVELRYFGISSKRYVCFRGEPTNPVIVKPSQHGVGVYFKPDQRKRYKPPDCLDDHDYPQSIIDDWLWVLREHFDPELNQFNEHPFADHVSMRKVRITTPRELAALRKLNPKVFPFNFGISPVIHSPEDVVLVAPMNDNPKKWRKLEYVDIHTGRKYRLFDSLGSAIERTSDALPQTYVHALGQFLRHPESKYRSGNADGLLSRWIIRAIGEPHKVGKEVERKREQGDDIANILMEPPIEYVRVRYETTKPLDAVVIEKLKNNFSISELARKTDLKRDTVRKALRGEPIWKQSRQKLLKAYQELKYKTHRS